MPPGSNRKQAASLAIQGAASSINNQMNYLNRSMQKIAKICGEEFADKIEYMQLRKKNTSIHHKYNQLAQEVKCLEQLLDYNDKSTEEASSLSSSSDEDVVDIEDG
ncbi:hypothetical protein ACHAW6_002781 [Cyclotella cf. meneghiniana]